MSIRALAMCNTVHLMAGRMMNAVMLVEMCNLIMDEVNVYDHSTKLHDHFNIKHYCWKSNIWQSFICYTEQKTGIIYAAMWCKQVAIVIYGMPIGSFGWCVMSHDFIHHDQMYGEITGQFWILPGLICHMLPLVLNWLVDIVMHRHILQYGRNRDRL